MVRENIKRLLPSPLSSRGGTPLLPTLTHLRTLSASLSSFFRLFAALALLAAFTSCGHLNGWGQVGPDLKPRLGANVSIPFGSK